MKTKQNKQTNEQQKKQKQKNPNKQDHWGFFNQTEIS